MLPYSCTLWLSIFDLDLSLIPLLSLCFPHSEMLTISANTSNVMWNEAAYKINLLKSVARATDEWGRYILKRKVLWSKLLIFFPLSLQTPQRRKHFLSTYLRQPLGCFTRSDNHEPHLYSPALFTPSQHFLGQCSDSHHSNLHKLIINLWMFICPSLVHFYNDSIYSGWYTAKTNWK